MPQINELTTRTFDGDSLIGFDVENTDPQTQAQYPYVTGKADGNALANFIANEQGYVTDLDTVDKHITGAINELHAINGYSYDAYDDTATYAVGDLCIYNNTLYKCTTAITTAEAWNASHWTTTSIADEISDLQSGKASLPTSVSGVAYNSNKIDSGNLYVYRIDKLIFVKAYLKVKTTLSDGDVILTGLPTRFNYRADNTYPVEIGNEFFNSASEMKACFIDASNQLCIATASSIDNTRVLLMNFWYLSV